MDKGMEESILRPTCDARDQSLALGAAGGVDLTVGDRAKIRGGGPTCVTVKAIIGDMAWIYWDDDPTIRGYDAYPDAIRPLSVLERVDG